MAVSTRCRTSRMGSRTICQQIALCTMTGGFALLTGLQNKEFPTAAQIATFSVKGYRFCFGSVLSRKGRAAAVVQDRIISDMNEFWV